MSTPINILLIGDGGVGKTTWLKSLKTGEFEKNYCATVGAEVHPMTFDGVAVNVWDVAGQNQYIQTRRPYYEKADAAIIMYDVTHEGSYKSAGDWFDNIRLYSSTIPIALVGNKIDDEENRKVSGGSYIMPNFDISVKNKQNRSAPFKWIVKNK
jgi:GTP-binding nuclear protein Ran